MAMNLYTIILMVVLLLLVSPAWMIPLQSRGNSCNVRPFGPIPNNVEIWYKCQINDLAQKKKVILKIGDETFDNIGEVFEKVKSVNGTAKDDVSCSVEGDPENVIAKTCNLWIVHVHVPTDKKSDNGLMLEFSPPEKGQQLKISVHVNIHPKPRLLTWKRYGLKLSPIDWMDCKLTGSPGSHEQEFYNCSHIITNPTENDLESQFTLSLDYEWDSIQILAKLAQTGLSNVPEEVSSSSVGWIIFGKVMIVILVPLLLAAAIAGNILHPYVDIKSYWNSWRVVSSTAGEQDHTKTEETPLMARPNPDPVGKTGDKAQAQQTQEASTTKVALKEDSAKLFVTNDQMGTVQKPENRRSTPPEDQG